MMSAHNVQGGTTKFELKIKKCYCEKYLHIQHQHSKLGKESKKSVRRGHTSRTKTNRYFIVLSNYKN